MVLHIVPASRLSRLYRKNAFRHLEYLTFHMYDLIQLLNYMAFNAYLLDFRILSPKK